MRALLGLTLLVSAVMLALVSGCGGNGSLSTVTSKTATTSPPPGQTFGQLADSGRAIFASRCAKCHGDQGQGITGPTLIGPNANLIKYTTAQGLLNFVDVAMPLDAPGSLSHQEYLQLLSLLLTQNGDVSAGATFSEQGLAGIQLK
jgi:mono/diheme cytochrome c family protein